MPGREEWENSEERYWDGILPPNQADRMIQLAEENQQVKPLDDKTLEQRTTELLEDFQPKYPELKKVRKW